MIIKHTRIYVTKVCRWNSKHRWSRTCMNILLFVSIMYFGVVVKVVTGNIESNAVKQSSNSGFKQECPVTSSKMTPMLLNAFYEVYETIFRFIGIYGEKNLSELNRTYPVALRESEIKSILRSDHKNLPSQFYPYVYRAVLAPKKRCQNSTSVNSDSILFLVKSSVDNFDRRMAIRNTWGDTKIFPTIRTIFFLGIKDKYKERVAKESNEFDDVVQYNFSDNYFNNTLKLIAAFHWTVHSCQGFKFVVMVDDDYLVITNRIQQMLQNEYFGSQKYLYMGEILKYSPPHRARKHKWYISQTDYPYDSYPRHVTGGTIIMSVNFISDVMKLIPYTKTIPLDDVYLGIIAYKLGIKPTHLPNITIAKTSPLSKHLLSSHGYGCPADMITAWYSLYFAE